jgi:acyl dehydratase
MSELSTSPGTTLSPYVRTTGLANWNRFAAVNDEFIDIHMDADAARAVGMPDAFGMGNLRISYLHNLLYQWLGDAGDIVDLRCEFRGLNLKGDTLTCSGTVTDTSSDGHRLAGVDLAVRNQDDVDTTPGHATVVLFDDGKAVMPLAPPPAEPSRRAQPGTFLQQATIDAIGRTLPPVAAPAVGANDIARWATATYWPDLPLPPTWTSRWPSAAHGRGSWRRGTSTRSPGCPTDRGAATGCGVWAPGRASGC